MNKKIGIITHHNSFNYGAALQAYATVSFFRSSQLDPVIINYQPAYIQGYGTYKKTFKEVSLDNVNILKKILFIIIKTPSYKKLKRRFDDFSSKEFTMTKPYLSIESLKEEIPDCEVFCTGSDQVWNNYYTHEFDGAYFLDFVPKKKKCFSLASSFGKENFSEQELSYIKEKVEKYEYLSVREETGLKILYDLGYSRAKLMIDPTLLISTEEWRKFANPPEYSKPYILVYQLHGDSNALKQALEFGKRKSIPVVSIITMYHQIRLGCKNVIVPKMTEFMGLFESAEYVFTDSFHGTVFSLQFGKKLAVVLPHNFSDRITTLLKSLNAESIIINDLDQWNKCIEELDLTTINNNLNALRLEKTSEISAYLSTL